MGIENISDVASTAFRGGAFQQTVIMNDNTIHNPLASTDVNKIFSLKDIYNNSPASGGAGIAFKPNVSSPVIS